MSGALNLHNYQLFPELNCWKKNRPELCSLSHDSPWNKKTTRHFFNYYISSSSSLSLLGDNKHNIRKQLSRLGKSSRSQRRTFQQITCTAILFTLAKCLTYSETNSISHSYSQHQHEFHNSAADLYTVLLACNILFDYHQRHKMIISLRALPR